MMNKALIMVLGLSLTPSVGASGFVAGSQPDRRPAQAPYVQFDAKSPAWYAQALQGVTQPFSPSLGFLEYQGAWYTPFTRPGMTGRYDMRRWHH